MNTAFLERYEGLRTRLPGAAGPREAAAAWFRDHGLPTRREEAWKYTDLRAIGETRFHGAMTDALGHGDQARLDAVIGELATPRLVFVDGSFRRDLSRIPAAIEVQLFAGLAATDPPARGVVALNAMLAVDGAGITVAAGVDAGTLLLVSLGRDLHGTPASIHPRHHVNLHAGAALSLVEIFAGEGEYLHNPVTEIAVGTSARLRHARLQTEATVAFHLATVGATLADGAEYDLFTLNLGARLSRTDITARLQGPGARVALNAAQVLGGMQHADMTTVVAHDAPHCASRQVVKNVLAGKSRGVFQGKIAVARQAQKTDGYQSSQSLLLSPDAEIDTKPELEIYADDVKCSHGATVGELNAEQIFYLRSRGVPEAQARAILVRAFLDEALVQIADPIARNLCEAALSKSWGHAP